MTEHEKRIREFLSERATMRGLCPEQIAGANDSRLNAPDLRALLADLDAVRGALSAAKDGGWQPIETMPAEGKFLVFMPAQRVNQIQAARRHNGLLVIGNAFAFDISDKPTHWQPLPNPPKGEV